MADSEISITYNWDKLCYDFLLIWMATHQWRVEIHNSIQVTSKGQMGRALQQFALM
jgi:hypothetical protein